MSPTGSRKRGAAGPRARRRRAAITGGAGFVGSHLVDRMVRDGWQVLVLDDLSTGTDGNLPGGARLERLDIVDGDVDRVLAAWRPNVVFHLAAQSSVPRSMAAPLRDLAVNVTGTHRVAEAARLAGVERLIFASSAGAIYGETTRPAAETSRPSPASYYGVHKLAAEAHIALAGMPFAIARPSNIYGQRQAAGLEGGVVATFVELARARRPLTIDGDGRQTRDFIHVQDVIDALIRIAGPSAPSGTWNVAAGRRTTILELADVLERAVGAPLERMHRPSRAGDVRQSSVSARRLRALGWRPSISLARGIRTLLDDRSLSSELRR